MEAAPGDITGLLVAWRRGPPRRWETLVPLALRRPRTFWTFLREFSSFRSEDARPGAWRRVFTSRRRVPNTSRRSLIGWPAGGLGAGRPRAPRVQPGSRPPPRRTSRRASGHEMPHAAARGCARRRRTPPGGAPSRRCRARAGNSHWSFSDRHQASIIELENFSSVMASRRRSTPVASSASTWAVDVLYTGVGQHHLGHLVRR